MGYRSERRGAGWNQKSWIKFGLVQKFVESQAAAFRVRFGKAPRVLLVDGNAGNGQGVHLPQPDLFLGDAIAKPTPSIICDLAERIGADALLCESKIVRRELLMHQFGKRATIIDDHDKVPSHLKDYNYVLWLADPCGTKDLGHMAMREVALRVVTSDFVIVFNEGWLRRLRGVKEGEPGWCVSHERYMPMIDMDWWTDHLKKRQVGFTPIIPASPGHQFRMLIVSNYLADAVKRHPTIRIRKARGQLNDRVRQIQSASGSSAFPADQR
jgi:hypothetical protein